MRVLVVEDERRLAERLRSGLAAEGYTVDLAHDGEEGGFLGETEPYAAIVLDLGLPRRDGAAVLRDWRAKGIATPVLLLTARDAWRDRVAGLDAGADDYLTKPFIMEELSARLRALIRRSTGLAQSVFQRGEFTFDSRSGKAALAGAAVALTAHEQKIIGVLLHRNGAVVSRTELAEQIYGYDAEDSDSNVIEVYIARLRKRLGADLIETVRGRGYRIGASAEAS